jgi:S1-C subfamily serine protease
LDAYGINVVEYNPTEEGHQRFAINEKDLKTLENQALRLMSEVAPSPSLDANGNPNGIRLDFLSEEPLAKQYGIRSGDVLTQINNKPVTNEMEAQAIYDGLGGDTRVVPFRVLRDEKEIIIYLEMDDFPGVAPQRK